MNPIYVSDNDKIAFVEEILSPLTGQYLYLNNKLSYISRIQKPRKITYFEIYTIDNDSITKYSITQFYNLYKTKTIKFVFSIKSDKTTYTLNEYYLLNNKKVRLTNILVPFNVFDSKNNINLNNTANRIALEHEYGRTILSLYQADNRLKQYVDEEDKEIDYRKKYLPEFRADDGHYVRSQGEMIIDNWLYNNNYLHEYEKKILYNNEEYIADFYLKNLDLYIEYFGLTNNEEYASKSEHKKEIYKNLGINCLYIYPEDIKHIQDILQKALNTTDNSTKEDNKLWF